jgi:glycosyltransferase involved in cell wall biosynthesis
VKINLCGPFQDPSGYGEFARFFAFALANSAAEISCENISLPISVSKPMDLGIKGSLVKSKLTINPKPHDVNIIFMIPPLFKAYRRKQAKYNIGFTMFEADKLPNNWAALCNEMDAIFVPSEWNKKGFIESGVTKPIFVVPAGVVRAEAITDPTIPRDDIFTFYSIFQWVERKNPLNLIKAYYVAMQNKPNVRMVLKTYLDTRVENNKERISYEINKLKKELKLSSYPELRLITNFLTTYEIKKLHLSSHCFVTPHRSEGWHMCLLPSTGIETNIGIKSISDIMSGDMVKTHSGNYKKVLAKSCHLVDEKIIKISALGKERSLWSTLDHPHLILKNNYKRRSQFYNYFDNNKVTPEWTAARQVSKNDMVCYPKSTRPLSSRIILNLETILCNEVTVDDNFIMSKHGRKTIFDKVSPVKIVKNIDVDSDFAEVIGIYLANGYAGKYRITCTSHSSENHARAMIDKVIRKISPNVVITSKIDGNKAFTRINSSLLSDLFKNLFGNNAFTKSVPQNMIDSIFSKDILRGIFYGDGTISGGRYKFYTVSNKLKNDIVTMLWNNNIPSYVSVLRRKAKNDRYVIHIPKQYNQRFEDTIGPIKHCTPTRLSKKCRYRLILEDEKYFYFPIVNIQYKQYSGNVMNLSISEDESFIANGIITHNCAMEAMSLGNAVIATNYSGNTQFMTPDTAILLPYFLTPCLSTDGFAPFFNGNMRWAEPSIESLIEKMEYVYSNQEECTKLGAIARQHILDNFNENSASKTLHNALQSVVKR